MDEKKKVRKMEENKIKIEKRALRLSFIGSFIFTLLEGIMFFLTKSHSILMDCIFDSAELIMIGPFMVLIPLLYKPVTEKRPYGFSQVESLLVIVKYGILTVITVQLMINNIEIIINGGHLVNAVSISIFELILGIGCILMFVILFYYSRKYKSMIIHTELYMWKVDILGSMGIALAFLVQIMFQRINLESIAPYIDPTVAIVMASLLLIEPIKLICQNLKGLVLFAPPEDKMEEIREVVETQLSKYCYCIEFLDVIQTGRKTWVQIYISSRTDSIQISDLYAARNEILKTMKSSFDQIYVEIIPNLPEE